MPSPLFRRPILGQQPGARHPFQIVLRHQPEDDQEFVPTEVPPEVVSQGETSSEDEACQTQTSHDFARPSACPGARCPSSACCWSGFSDSIHSSGLMLPFHDIRARTGKALAPHLARPSPRPLSGSIITCLWFHFTLNQRHCSVRATAKEGEEKIMKKPAAAPESLAASLVLGLTLK